MKGTSEGPTNTPLPYFDADTQDQFLSLENYQHDLDWSSILNLPINSPVAARADDDLEKAPHVGAPESLSGSHANAISRPQENGPGTGIYSNTISGAFFELNEQDQADNPLPSIEQEPVQLRDAKQVLAEHAAERKRKREQRAMESPTPRKRSRKPTSTPQVVDLRPVKRIRSTRTASTPRRIEPSLSAKQHRPESQKPTPTPQELNLPPTTAKQEEVAHSLPPPPQNTPHPQPQPSHTLIPTPIPTPHELTLFTPFLAFTPKPLAISLGTTYTTDLLNSLTNTLSDTLWKDHPQSTASESSLRSFISARVSAWPYAKLRVLAHMGVLPGWWWMRERLVAVLLMRGVVVDDGVMVESWKWHEGRVGGLGNDMGDGMEVGAEGVKGVKGESR